MHTYHFILYWQLFPGVKKKDRQSQVDGRKYVYEGLTFAGVHTHSVWLDHNYSCNKEDFKCR